MELYAFNPGPLDDSVLYDQEKHVSSAVWEGQVKLLAICFCQYRLSLNFMLAYRFSNMKLFRSVVHLDVMNTLRSSISGY